MRQRLHSKLYRARCVDEAIDLFGSDWDGTIRRAREGVYHVVDVDGDDSDAEEVLAFVCDAALVLTVERAG